MTKDFLIKDKETHDDALIELTAAIERYAAGRSFKWLVKPVTKRDPKRRWKAYARIELTMTEIVAEISGNHGGSLHNARRLIRAARTAGADAVKFQCFDPERLATRRAKRPDVLALAGGVPLIDLYMKIHTPREWFPALKAYAEDDGLAWFSSVFDPEDVAFLETLSCPRYKISAFEMLDWDIIKAVRETGKPIVISVRPTDGVTILQASNYDGSFESLGVSCHGCTVAYGCDAPMIEWHLKLPDVETPDSEFSLTQAELRDAILWTGRKPNV